MDFRQPDTASCQTTADWGPFPSTGRRVCKLAGLAGARPPLPIRNKNGDGDAGRRPNRALNGRRWEKRLYMAIPIVAKARDRWLAFAEFNAVTRFPFTRKRAALSLILHRDAGGGAAFRLPVEASAWEWKKCWTKELIIAETGEIMKNTFCLGSARFFAAENPSSTGETACAQAECFCAVYFDYPLAFPHLIKNTRA